MDIDDLAKRLGLPREHLALLEAGAECPHTYEVMEIAAALDTDHELLFEDRIE